MAELGGIVATREVDDRVTPVPQTGVLSGGGEMGATMRAMNWSHTPLGPVAEWPQALKTSVRIMLTSRQPMFVWWGDELINLYNDAYRDILGGKHPWALGQPAEIVWQEIWDQVEPRARSAMQGNEGTYDEALLLIMERHGYPEETYYTFSYSPVPNDAGGTGGILCANTNDTQRIIGERQLALLRTLATETADARTVAGACQLSSEALETNLRDLPFALLYLVDREQKRATLAGLSNISPGHPAAPEVLDLDSNAVWPLGMVLRNNQPSLLSELPTSLGPLPHGPWNHPPTQAAILPIAASGETGRAAILIAGLNPYRLFDTDYRRFLELAAGQIGSAITNAQAYEEERTRADALAELDRAKTTFFSNVSHEFRTPLTLLLGPLEDSLAAGDLSEDDRKALIVVHRNALRLLRLVNVLLDFSRIEAGRIQASYELTDLPAYTAELASTFRSAMERAGLRLVVDCPPLPTSSEVYVDHDMWEKIILNLLSNALKFTFAGEIAVALRQVSESVELVVRDTGTGIPPEELPRLFERFNRVQGARARTHEGTGIGLALVQELVTLHGGTVRVESVVDRGTTFTVTVPTGRAHLPADRVGAQRTLASTTTGATPYVEEALRWLPSEEDGRSPLLQEEIFEASSAGDDPRPGTERGRVLLADDNADMREYIARLLSQRYEVEAVPDGEAALATLQVQPPDLVLSDIMMPRLDGFGLLRALRSDERTRDIPVILLSARAGEEARVEGIDAGADDYLVKPFATRELLARVSTHIALARKRADSAHREQMARAEAELERGRLCEWLLQAPAAIAVLRGPEHVYELANHHYAQIFGSQREYMGRPVREVFADVDRSDIWELLDQVYASGAPYVGTEWLVELDRHGNGTLEERFYNFVFQPMTDGQGVVTGIFIHAVDVTDQVRARHEAEAAVRTRDEFLSIASHELRTPITVVKGVTQLLQRTVRRGHLDPEKLRRHIDTMERASNRLSFLANDLLDVSRLQGGQLALREEQIDLVGLVQDVVDRYAEQLAEDRALTSDVPETMVLVFADPARLEQVFENLLGNAAKYSSSGDAIKVTLRVDAGGVTVAVADRGIGLPNGVTESIFEPFHRAKNAHDLPGLGLGLYVSRRIAELHGGRIWAESAGEGQGTTLFLWLPTVSAARDSFVM